MMGEVCASSFRGLRSALGLGSSKSPLPRRMCSAHVIGAISRGRIMQNHAHAKMDHRFWHGSKCLRGFWSPRCARQNEQLFSVQLECHARLHVCISCRSQRKHARHIASIRDMLHIESSRRFWRVCVNTCRAHMRIRALASAGHVRLKVDRRFRHVCPIFSFHMAAEMQHMSNSAIVFGMLPFQRCVKVGSRDQVFTPFARRTSYAKC